MEAKLLDIAVWCKLQIYISMNFWKSHGFWVLLWCLVRCVNSKLLTLGFEDAQVHLCHSSVLSMSCGRYMWMQVWLNWIQCNWCYIGKFGSFNVWRYTCSSLMFLLWAIFMSVPWWCGVENLVISAFAPPFTFHGLSKFQIRLWVYVLVKTLNPQ